MFPKCDGGVTGPPITVSRLGTPWWHSRCTGHVDPRCTASVHGKSIQDVPRGEPGRVFASVHPGCPRPAHLGYTGQFHPGWPGCFPARYTTGISQPEGEVRTLSSGWCWVFHNISVGVVVVVVLAVRGSLRRVLVGAVVESWWASLECILLTAVGRSRNEQNETGVRQGRENKCPWVRQESSIN